MDIRYICPYWGQGETTAAHFISKVLDNSYDGIEIDIPVSEYFEKSLLAELDKVRKEKSFFFIAQQWLPPATETFGEYSHRFSNRLEHLVLLRPDFINSHTGKDHFSFDD